jgi:signal transduction histidine kinase
MNYESLGSLFNDFTKIPVHRDLNKEGVGLGLTISKNLA